MKPHDVLREYIEHSEKREIIPNRFYARMSPEIAKNFDDGLYNFILDEHKECISELETLNIKYPAYAQPKFYIYIVPDENFIELLKYPYKDRKGGGRPVPAYDMDSFNSAYGTSQNLLIGHSKVSVAKHINHIHEYAHLIHQQFNFCAQMFGEGFAELIPWYALEYEKKLSSHLETMKSLERIITKDALFALRDKLRVKIVQDLEVRSIIYMYIPNNPDMNLVVCPLPQMT